MPTTISGTLHPSNKNSIDWSEKGLIAFASHSIINIIDPWTKQRIQVLEHHSSAICELHWCPNPSLGCSPNGNDVEESLLVSVDIGGLIVVADALSASSHVKFRLPGSNVLSICWFVWRDTGRDFLLALHSRSTLILWNADTGEKVWKCENGSNLPLYAMSCDPFDPRRVAFSSSGTSVVVSGELGLSAPSPSACSLTLSLSQAESSSNSATLIDVIAFHKAYRNQLFAASEGMLYIADVEAGVVLNRVSLDSSAILLMPASLRDALFVVHNNGSLTFRVADWDVDNSPAGSATRQVCSSESGRQTGQKRPVAAALCPSTEAAVAVLQASGRVSVWQLENEATRSLDYRSYTLSDVVSFTQELQTIATPGTRLRQSGCVFSLSAAAAVVRVRPLVTEGDDVFGRLQLAVIGTHAGVLHLVDLFTARVIREWSVQASPIKNAEWAGPYQVLSTGYNHALSSTLIVRNDLFITDIRTGSSRRIRPEVDESPLTILRLSHYKCYMALAFQRDPLEIWDLRAFRLLRRMSKTCPLIVDLAWSCKHHGVRQTEKLSVYRENLVVLDSENRLYHVVVKGLHVRDGKEVNTQWKGGGWQLRGMAWKDDLLALADADGRLVLWNLMRRQSREARAVRTPPLRMAFSALSGDHTLTVMHQREVVVWDAESLTLSSHVQLDTWRTAVDMDLCGLSCFVLATDNTLSIAGRGGAANRPVPDNDVPVLLGKRQKRESLISASWSSSPMTFLDDSSKTSLDVVPSLSAPSSPARSLSALSSRLSSASLLEREAALARFFGHLPAHALLLLAISHLENSATPPLPPHLELFWPPAQLRHREEACVSRLCSLSASASAPGAAGTRLPSRSLSLCVERAIVLGGTARELAVDVLLGATGGTDTQAQDLLLASLKAALLVSHQDSEQAKSLIKLIATNLIASDHMTEGMELLLLVDAGADACKYLQSQRLWHKSVRYAKLALSPEQADETIQKWISHLQMDQRTTCALAEASRSGWQAARSLLSALGNERLAAVLEVATASS